MTLGHLSVTGFIGDGPDNGDVAFLLLTTPGDGTAPAEFAMQAVATVLGLGRAGSVTDATHLSAELAGDHITLSYGEIIVERPMSPEWTTAARQRGKIMLVVGLAPLSPQAGEEEVFAYAGPANTDCLILGLVPVKVL